MTRDGDKIPTTALTGKYKSIELPVQFNDSIQTYIKCGCRIDHCDVYEYKRCKIGGKKFTSGEVLCVGRRCGSVVTMVSGDRSVYGLIKYCYRVSCQCLNSIDFVVVTWFPFPTYPDRDPLTVKIVIRGLDINNITQMCVTPLCDVQPSRIAVELEHEHNNMYMLRLEGIDTNPMFNN